MTLNWPFDRHAPWSAVVEAARALALRAAAIIPQRERENMVLTLKWRDEADR